MKTRILFSLPRFVRNFPSVENLIKHLDVLLPQVLIEAQIIEVTLDDESAFGVEWMWEQGTTINNETHRQNGTTDFGLAERDFRSEIRDSSPTS